MTGHPRKPGRIGRFGTVMVALVMLVAVVDKSNAALQSPSAIRIIMVGFYVMGLAAACFTLWPLVANSRGDHVKPVSRAGNSEELTDEREPE